MITYSAKNLVLFFIFLSLFCFCSISHANTIEMELSRDKLAFGESFTITYQLKNIHNNTRPDFTPLETDFHIVGTHYGAQINVLNGITQSQTYWQVTLEPKKTGELIIPEINFGNAKSASRKLWVEEASAVLSNKQQNTSAFVKAEINTTSPYIQSQVLYTFKLFYRAQLDNSILEPPQIKDGLLAQVGNEKYYQSIINSEHFNVFEKTFAIYPNKAGKLVIPPAHFRATQIDFLMASSNTVNLGTQSFTLNVQKIPDNYQGKIWLPSRHIALTEKWSSDPNRWEAGNPITRTISIEADGLRADQIPDLPVDKIPGVNVYTDTPHRNNNLQGNTVIGIWQQTITYIPNQPQSFTIPALKLNWWNTQTNSNASAELKTINVQVQGKIINSGSTTATVLPTTNPNPPVKNAPNISMITPGLHSNNSKTLQSAKNENIIIHLSIWFWVAIILLVTWLSTLFWIWKNKSVKNVILNSNTPEDIHDSTHSSQFNEKLFAEGCKKGDCVLTQRLLLMWAKSRWPNPPCSLGKLRETISDETLKKEVEALEKALYSDERMKWNGYALLTAFQQFQKNKKYNLLNFARRKGFKNEQLPDPLPPLYPE